MNDAVFDVRGLSAAHGQLVAVRGTTLARGEVLALVGANGAGKTTLLRTLAGVHAAAAGRVACCGDDITACRPTSACAAAWPWCRKAGACSAT